MEVKYLTEPERKTPVVETDVFEAGAGTAGCVAAIAAARAGAGVVLVERTPVPGGTLTNGGIGISSFYSATKEPEKAKRIVGGIAYELMERLQEAGGATEFIPMPGDQNFSPYRIVADHEIYKAVISKMLMEAGVRVFLSTMFCDVCMEDGADEDSAVRNHRIKAVFIENKDGRSAVVAKQYIDASGDGDIARMAGLEQTELWQRYHEVCGGPNGLVFGMAGIDFERAVVENPTGFFKLGGTTDQGGGIVSRRFAFTHVKDKEKYAAFADLDINFFTSMQSIHEGELTYSNNSKGADCNVCDAESLSRAEMESRVMAMEFADAMKKCVPGCENSYISWASTQMGVRASRITMCDKMIAQEEISAAKRFEDEVGFYGFQDLWPKRKEWEICEPGFYGMPYRMLLPGGCDNLYMAGRCVTGDIEAHMSTRNTVGCMIMGQGAGVAAALCARADCGSRELPYGRLREELLAQNVILEV